MKLEKIDSREQNGRKAAKYSLGRYIVVANIATYNDGTVLKRISVTGIEKYLPEIYYDDIYGEEFKIQTTSYGALSTNEIQKVIEGYQEAVEAVAILTKEFIG